MSNETPEASGVALTVATEVGELGPDGKETTPQKTEAPSEPEPSAEAQAGDAAEPGTGENVQAEPEVQEQAETQEEAATEGETPEVKAEAKPEPAKPQVDPELERQARWAAEMDERMRRNPRLRQGYLQSLKDEGQLDPRWEPELEALNKAFNVQPAAADVKQPEPPKVTEAEVRAKVKQLMAEGKEDQAIDLLTDWKLDNRVAPKLSALEQQQAAELKARQEAERQAQIRAEQDRNYREVSALADKLPDLIQKTDNGGFMFKDAEFHKRLVENVRLHEKAAPLEKIAELTLWQMGRLASPQAKPPAPKPAGKPVLKSKPAPVAKEKPSPEEGEGVALKVFVG